MTKVRTVCRSLVFTALSISLCAASVAADSEQKYKDLLIKVLTANSRGECPSDLMSVMLQDACEQQMPNMKPQFDHLGPIQGATFRGIQQFPAGPAEVYRVAFANGQMTWAINTGPDGKILVLWSPG